MGWTLVWLSAGALLRVALAAAFVVAFTSEEWDSVDLGREVDAAKVGWTLVWLSAGALLRVALAAAFVVAFASEWV